MGNPAVFLHPPVGRPNGTFGNRKWLCFTHQFLPFQVDSCVKPDDATPSLHRHYQASSLLRVAPPLCAASGHSCWWRYPLEPLPSHRHDRFPRSCQEPRTASRPLRTGHRPASKQAPSGLLPGHRTRPGFDVIEYAFDASARVRLRSSHCSLHDVSCDAFSSTLTTLTLNQSRLRSFKASPCRAALAGLPPSLHKLCTFVTS